jgi:hypothetical protein
MGTFLSPVFARDQEGHFFDWKLNKSVRKRDEPLNMLGDR